MPSASPVAQRQRAMAIVARTTLAEVEARWTALQLKPRVEWLRRPETGLSMVRGRIGGSGDAFNLGEVTVTRCALRWIAPSGPIVGIGYVAGRSHRHAEVAAMIDAAAQDPETAVVIDIQVIRPLAEALRSRDATEARKAAATRAEFFTMVRSQ
ncbi:MAG: phosphonate C-P lyase system protein PhnG [Burkholderiales bacterium]